jgi:hypothetical protein
LVYLVGPVDEMDQTDQIDRIDRSPTRTVAATRDGTVAWPTGPPR